MVQLFVFSNVPLALLSALLVWEGKCTHKDHFCCSWFLFLFFQPLGWRSTYSKHFSMEHCGSVQQQMKTKRPSVFCLSHCITLPTELTLWRHLGGDFSSKIKRFENQSRHISFDVKLCVALLRFSLRGSTTEHETEHICFNSSACTNCSECKYFRGYCKEVQSLTGNVKIHSEICTFSVDEEQMTFHTTHAAH